MVDHSTNFPKEFYWGAATSAHQVEGGNLNTWSEWEKNNATRLATEAVERAQQIAKYTGVPAQLEQFHEMPFDPANYVSGRASDHYSRYPEDFKLMKKLGLNAFRFSIEWSRIEPTKGQFTKKELDHYIKYVDTLLDNGIEPFLTLWHWPFPLWVGEDGWLSPTIKEDFIRYTEKIFTTFEDRVKYWITLNEPMVYTSCSYYVGLWPPEKKSLAQSYRVLKRMASAHKGAYKIGKEINPHFNIGIAKNCSYNHAYPDNFINRAITRAGSWVWNEMFLDWIADYQDFIGLNNYGRNRMKYGRKVNENKKVSDMGWELYPEGIEPLLVDLYSRYKKPIYITENGLADKDDLYRAWFIEETVKALSNAIEKGVDLKGYLHWSLLDNFEWDKGFWPRFGLVEVDYRTFKRTIRQSAYRYSALIKQYSSNE